MRGQYLLTLILLIFSFNSSAQLTTEATLDQEIPSANSNNKSKVKHGFKLGYFQADHKEALFQGKEINGVRLEAQRYVDLDSNLKTVSAFYSEFEGATVAQESFDGLALGVMQKVGYESNIGLLPFQVFVYGGFGIGYQSLERTINNNNQKLSSIAADLQLGTEFTSRSGVGLSFEYSAREHLSSGKVESSGGSLDRAIAPSTRLNLNLFYRF